MLRTYDVIVIGAGVNGLTAAALLAKAGQSVLVLEQRVAGDELLPGFRADPYIDDVGWLTPQLQRELELQRHGLELLAPQPSLVALLPDRRALTLWRDLRRAVESIRMHSPEDANNWVGFSERIARLAGFLGVMYQSRAPRLIGGSNRDLLELAQLGRKLRGLGKDEMLELLRVLPMSVAELLEDSFQTEVLQGAVGASGITGLCQGPRAAGTAFVLLHNAVAAAPGAFRMRPRYRGGVGAVVQALTNAARASGVQLQHGARVARINVNGGRAAGVVLEDGVEIPAARVLSSADARSTLLGLVGAAHLDPEQVRALKNIRYRGVVARVHLVLAELPRFRAVDTEALHGSLCIAPTLNYLERAYDHAKYGRISTAPYLELSIPSLDDATVAPPGEHLVSVTMQYAPYHLSKGSWDHAQREALGDLVVNTLAEYAPNLPGAVLMRSVLTPRDLEDVYSLPEGNIEHGELGLDQILFMRPLPGWSRYATPVNGLYLCGADTHPGRAVAGQSGRLAARAALAKLRV